MASCSISPGNVLLTGGFSRRGREAAVRILRKGQAGWRVFSPDTSGDMGKVITIVSSPLVFDAVTRAKGGPTKYRVHENERTFHKHDIFGLKYVI